MQRSAGEAAVEDAAPGGVGAVTLVAGYGTFAQPGRAQAAVAMLGRVAEAFLDGRSGWRLQRLAPGDAETPTRVAMRRAIDGLVRTEGPCVVVLVGAVVSTIAGPAIACATDLGPYPEDTTLPLAWIGERLRQYRGDGLVCVLAAEGDERDRRQWLAELAPDVRGLVVVASSVADTLEALLEGVWGDAIDEGTGSVSGRSLGAHLARRLPSAAIQPSRSEGALVTPPPVAARHDPRLSRLLAGGVAAAAEPDLIGKVLSGRFRVEAELGRGGFGVVYKAHHDLLGRDFALKVLTIGDAASREDAEMFLQEIRWVARLDHRNVVRVHFADVLGRRRMFFAMELLGGRDLQRILETEGAMAPARAMALAAQLLAGLGAAHATGLVHADVKPANLIAVDEAGKERLVLVDFGLARLRGAEPSRTLGGTTAFMAPEQRRDGVVDARSDLYAAGRVLVALLRGRVDEDHGLADVADPVVRAALARALAEDPADRFASAAEMDAALRGATVEAVATAPRPPFRHAAPFVERDRDDFHGRDRDIAALVDAVLFRRCVVYAAPSGAGKTSLLRAGLAPRLNDLGVTNAYVGCRAGMSVDTIRDVAAGAGTRLVLVLDQLEQILLSGSQPAAELFAAVATAMAAAPQLTVVLSVREEMLARVLEHTEGLAPGPPLRLGPLTSDEARRVITLTLAARRLAISTELLDALVGDLEAAARGMPAQLGWGETAAVYPPHLQLAGAVLYEAMPSSATTFTVESYHRLGGLARILGEHLHRVLEGELTPARTAIAREVLLALVTASQTRRSAAQSELAAIVATGGRSRAEVIEVIEFLRDRGLLVALPGRGDDPIWELAHDSLVPRIEAWVTATDLARLRALELIRHRLRRSDRGPLSLLDVGELREVARCTTEGDLAVLDAEWTGRVDVGDAGRARSASTLVALSRRAVRARRIAATSALGIAGVVVSVLAVRWQSERSQRQHEASLRDRDIGAFSVQLSAFDWDAAANTAIDVPLAELPALDWSLHKPAVDDADAPGEVYPADDLIRHVSDVGTVVREDALSARGGPAVFVVRGRGRRLGDGSVERCADSIIPVRRLPGYSAPGPAPVHRLRVPTCTATRADTIDIAGGPFLAGGGGDPAASFASALPREQTIELAPYAIDRTEVTNAAFAVFTSMSSSHGVVMTDYPATEELRRAAGSDYPVAFINWPEARAFCRYMGKDLPSLDQWDRALRGGLTVDGAANTAPRRTFAWPGPFVAGAAAVPDDPSRRHPFPVGTHPKDRSPDGVMDLTGNLQEWVLAAPPEADADITATDEAARAAAWRWSPASRFRIMRGCNWNDLECSGGDSAVDFAALPNQRPFDLRNFYLGFRCVSASPR